MLSVQNKFYAPALRWKKGEMEALYSLDAASKERLLPHLVFPPVGSRDVEKGRALSRDEFSLLQVGRLQRFWEGRPCLADFRFLRFDDDKGSDAARLSELLTLCRKFGCRVIPVVDQHVDPYRLSAISSHIQNSKSGGAIRIALRDLQNDDLGEMLQTLYNGLQLTPPECLLVLDLGEAAISNTEAFSKFVAEWIGKLQHMGLWHRIIVEASSYPTKNPAPSNGEITVPRNEWLAWRQIMEADKALSQQVLFGDYGADHGHIDFDGGGRTLKHLRYATPESWLVGRGGDPIQGHDGTIHTVATRIVGSGMFLGEEFSAGDEFIALCAEKASTGNGSTWRWANMVHHMTLATVGVGNLVGVSIERPRRAPVARQLSLLG